LGGQAGTMGDQKAAVEASVTYAAPLVESKTGAVMVGIDLPAEAANAGLRPGLTVHVRIVAEEHKDALVVPREAVDENENGDAVVAVVTDDIAVQRTVKTGLEENGMIEIITDLKAGSTVVTQGTFGLRTPDQTLQQTRVKVVH